MSYTEHLKNYLDYAEKHYQKDYVSDVNTYFSLIEKYLYPKIEEVDKFILQKSIATLSKKLMNNRGAPICESAITLFSLYYQFTQYIYQKVNRTRYKYIKDLLEEYISSNPNITRKEKLYLSNLIDQIETYHVNITNILKLKSATREHFQDYRKIYPDKNLSGLFKNITGIIDDFEEFIKREGVNS
jgi:vacuolar-type H+-ATPase catalytic subunit A/Vma1